MGAPTEVYVDPAINANSGSGTSGDPYGDLQYALNQVTRDATNGNRFNIKAGTAELLTAVISLATYGTPAFSAPCVFQGYTSAAGDGGIGQISCNGGNYQIWGAAKANIHFYDLELFNTTAAIMVQGTTNTNFDNCYLHNAASTTLLQSASGIVTNNRFELTNSPGDYAVFLTSGTTFFVGNRIEAIGGTGVFGLRANQAGTVIRRNLIVNCAGAGIYVAGPGGVVDFNSVLTSGSTGTGIWIDTGGSSAQSVVGNLVEGYSGSGGRGIRAESDIARYGYNAVFNCETPYAGAADIIRLIAANETLGSTPFAKSGANTWANRFTYFAPLNVGAVWNGTPGNFDKGAVQHVAAAGALMLPIGWDGGVQ